LEKSRKWIIREGLTGISRNGSGAPIAKGWKKSLGFLTLLLVRYLRAEIYSLGHFCRLRPSYSRPIEASQRDNTQDWLLPAESTPPLLGELVERIEEALDVAYASESAIASVGAAATEAAERARDAFGQAQRAAEQAYKSAEFAERASAAMLEDRRRRTIAGAVPTEDIGLRNFTERADRVVARLRALESLPA
jgi:hypothetical protein